MAGLVALVVGISRFPGLPNEWNVRIDLTANDAIAVARALRARGVPAEKIKLMLSSEAQLPNDVAGIVPVTATKDALETFLGRELGQEPFTGNKFFFFCSGHGVSASKQQETFVVCSDCYTRPNKRKVFHCLPVEEMRIQLQAEAAFTEQIFCINACRTPEEWSVTSSDTVLKVGIAFDGRPPARVAQARFFSAEELAPTPVEDAPDGYSNGFAKAVVECIEQADWPPRPREWRRRLKNDWDRTDALGIQGPDPDLFRRLAHARHDLDRSRQIKLSERALKGALKWRDRRADPSLWRSTIIDLHGVQMDCFDFLWKRLSETVFAPSAATVGLSRASWPRRTNGADRRKRELLGELAYALTDERSRTSPLDVLSELIALPCSKAVFVEIHEPCEEDREVVEAMLTFWRSLIEAAAQHVPSPSSLPILIVGHVEPVPGLDTTLFYRDETLADHDERRLNVIEGPDIYNWIEAVIPKKHPQRLDVEADLARALGVRFVDDISERLRKIVNAIDDHSN